VGQLPETDAAELELADEAARPPAAAAAVAVPNLKLRLAPNFRFPGGGSQLSSFVSV
jgi:hypothetical protein